MSRLVLSVLFLIAAPAVRGQEFFPDTDTSQAEQELQFRAPRYSKYFIAMHEPSLWELSRREPTIEMYRLTLLPSFSSPICIRVVVDGPRDVTVLTKFLDGNGGYDPGKLVVDRSTRPTNSRSATFHKELLRRSQMWDLPTFPAGDRITLDGTEWIVEWLKNGRYHVVIRTSPPHRDPVYSFGIFLAKDLAGLKLGKDVQ
jgi:hypothetical protein